MEKLKIYYEILHYVMLIMSTTNQFHKQIHKEHLLKLIDEL